MRVSVGASLARPPVSAGGPASPNANLLLWSEELDRAAVWVTAGGATVTADQGQDELGATTADSVALAGGASLSQTTTVAAATGGPIVGAFVPGPTRTAFSFSGTFDGSTYFISGYQQDLSDSGLEVGVLVQRVGGFIQVRFRDTGDEPTALLSWIKLETPTLTAYVKREGT